jgi:galactokinase/mevalonate kinase-like predicted kinase
MRYILTIPARINILGNPGDANEGDFATISTAINLRAGAIIEEADHIIFESGVLDQNQSPNKIKKIYSRSEFTFQQLPLKYNNELNLMKAALNQLHRFSQELQEKITTKGIRITIWTNVPRQSGLGGSSLLILLVLAGLREWYQLDPHIHNNYLIAELTQHTEAKELGITCGFADRYVPLFGGLAYLDYRGKLHQKDLHQEPYVTYERLDPYINELPIIAVSTGVKHDSGDVHGKMRPKYLHEFDNWQQNCFDMPPMVAFMSKAWETAWKGKIALLKNDLETFGMLMNTNHQVVSQMMKYCGFSDGAGFVNNLFTEFALENGAYGAKLTGAGGGGSVFALAKPGSEKLIEDAWRNAIKRHKLTSAYIFRPKISKQGLIVDHKD